MPDHQEDIDIGGRLRHIRSIHGLSQRKLARLTGVTHSTISLIESNRMSPSVGALKRILDGIPMGLSEFFSSTLPRQQQIFFAASELREIGKGGVSLRQVGNPYHPRDVQILDELYQPGAGTGKVMLSHDGQEGGVVISGRLEVTIDGQRKILGPGDAYYFKSHLPHQFRAIGKDPCRVISACTPPTF